MNSKAIEELPLPRETWLLLPGPLVWDIFEMHWLSGCTALIVQRQPVVASWCGAAPPLLAHIYLWALWNPLPHPRPPQFLSFEEASCVQRPFPETDHSQ